MITIEVSGGGILFTFTGNQHYLYDGSIEVPTNSLSLVVDESDMFTFYKAASNDIFISARYDDLGWTKEQLIEFYKSNMVANGGGSSITEIYVGCPTDSVDANTGVVTKNDCEKKDQLCIVYKSEQGTYSMVKVGLDEFVLESETASGVTTTDDGVIIGVVDPRSEWVFIDYNASGVPTTSGAVLSTNVSGFTVHNIQTAIDKKAKAVVKKVEETAEYVWDSTENKMVLRLRDIDDVILNDIQFFDTNYEGDILLPGKLF